MSFKKGDRVVCVDARKRTDGIRATLVRGKVYNVLRTNSIAVAVDDLLSPSSTATVMEFVGLSSAQGHTVWWRATRFVLAPTITVEDVED